MFPHPMHEHRWIQKLRKARALSLAEWAFLLRAAAGLWAVRWGLKLGSLQKLLAFLEPRRTGKNPKVSGSRVCLERMPYLVGVASRYSLPNTTCLERSLVLYHLLRCYGAAATLMIGANTAGGNFQAHAWVEHNGQRLGAQGTEISYAPLASFPDALVKGQTG